MSESFDNYDRAAEALQEARDILAIDPTHKPAQERVDDALQLVAHEIGQWLKRTNQPCEIICTKCGLREQRGEKPSADF